MTSFLIGFCVGVVVMAILEAAIRVCRTLRRAELDREWLLYQRGNRGTIDKELW